MPTPSPRRDARRDYRHFPAEYTSLLLAFDRDGHADIGPLDERSARAAVRDLYRFKMFLSAGCDADPSDAHARELLTIFSRAVIRLEPVACLAAGEGDTRTHLISFTLNPIVAAVRAAAEGGAA